MKSRILTALLLLPLFFSAGRAWSGERWRELPPEERHELRQQMREHWQREHAGPQKSITDDGAPRRRDLSPDERRRLRDELRERHGKEGREGRRPKDRRYDD